MIFQDTKKLIDKVMEEIRLEFPRIRNAVFAENIMKFLGYPKKAMTESENKKTNYYSKIHKDLTKFNSKKFSTRLIKGEK